MSYAPRKLLLHNYLQSRQPTHGYKVTYSIVEVRRLMEWNSSGGRAYVRLDLDFGHKHNIMLLESPLVADPKHHDALVLKARYLSYERV